MRHGRQQEWVYIAGCVLSMCTLGLAAMALGAKRPELLALSAIGLEPFLRRATKMSIESGRMAATTGLGLGALIAFTFMQR